MKKITVRSALIASILALVQTASGESPGSLLIHPPYAAETMSREHPAGHERALGDRLGRDFMVIRLAGQDHPWPHPYRSDGSRNRDWFGWHLPVLAPIDGIVERVHVNPALNRPGRFGQPPASQIRLRRDDGTRVLIAHVRAIGVAEGEKVRAGQPLALTGNDGHAFAPHIHIGAWRDGQPLQIRVDLEALGELVEPFGP